MKKFAVIEDNGGGLALVVYDANGKIEYIHTGYEYNPGQISEDLKVLKNGGNPAKEWDGNDLYSVPEMEEPEELESWFPWEQKNIGWNIVADNDGIYPEKMGSAARLEFGIEREYEQKTDRR